MTDFYALLKQSIVERDIRDARDRKAVYAQARQAIVRQLWAFRPPLAADEIDTRVGAYDQAVERIERDLRAEFAEAAEAEAAEPARRNAATGAARPRAARTVRPRPELSPPLPDPEPLTELEAVREDDDEDEIAAPPLAEWRHAEAEEAPLPFEDEPPYERGVPRAGRASERSRPSYEADDRNDRFEDDRPPRDGEYEDADDGYEPQEERRSRWQDDGRIVERLRWWSSFSDRDKIRLLAGAIATLVVALIGLLVYLYVSRGPDDGVTLDIGVRREVSDAATAARIAADTLEVVESYSVFEGRDPTIFATTPDNPVRYVSEGGFARISSSSTAPGVKAHIGPGLADRIAGRAVRITLVARAAEENGAASMRFAYQSGVAISHWQTANLSPQYEAVGMVWRPPAMRTGSDGDYLVIEPGIPGDGTAVDIQSIRIDVLAGEGS